MVGELLIGFSSGILFSISLSGVARSIGYYFKFRAAGRLLELEEVEEKFGGNLRFYILSDSFVFNTILLPRDGSNECKVTPWEVLSDGFMLTKIRTTEPFFERSFRNPGCKKFRFQFLDDYASGLFAKSVLSKWSHYGK